MLMGPALPLDLVLTVFAATMLVAGLVVAGWVALVAGMWPGEREPPAAELFQLGTGLSEEKHAA